MVRIDREVLIFDQDLACLEVRRFGVEGRMDDVEGVCRIRQRAIGGRAPAERVGFVPRAAPPARPPPPVDAEPAPPRPPAPAASAGARPPPRTAGRGAIPRPSR